MNRRTFLAAGLASSLVSGARAGGDGVPTSALMNNHSLKLKEPRVIAHVLKDAGTIPNSRLPLLIYQEAFELPQDDPATALETLLRGHAWGNDWRNGIFTYHHYHSTAHEALFVYSGSAKVQVGGEGGPVQTINAGDVVIIPAGVGHKNLGASSDFHVIGAYPPEQNVDMNYGKPGERPRVDEHIARLALPTTDPVFGKKGPLLEHWRPAR
jgi:uncharacterized protein YjlB